MTANQSPVIWVDGVEGERLSPLDRGLAYGDGLFETCRVAGACIPLWARHRARLLAGLARLGMELTGAELDKSVRQALSGAPTEAGILKLIVSRRAAGRGYQAADNPHTSTTVIFFPATGAVRARARCLPGPALPNPGFHKPGDGGPETFVPAGECAGALGVVLPRYSRGAAAGSDRSYYRGDSAQPFYCPRRRPADPGSERGGCQPGLCGS